MAEAPASVDAYIAGFPEDVQEILQRKRRAIHEAVPGLEESISYGIPTVRRSGPALMSFAGWKKHVSVYPTPTGDPDFEARIAPYRSSRSTAKFPLSEPVPYDLVGDCATLLAQQRG